jgi:predicted cation transporter
MKFLAVLVLFLAFSSYSQNVTVDYNDSLITIKGQVKDTSQTVGFYNVVVLNKTVGKGIFGEHNGKYSITVKKGDKVGISVVGYHTIYLSYKDSAYQSSYTADFILKPLTYYGKEVVVKPLKTLKELQEERASIAKREVPTVTVTNAIQSPITALYVAFSKREKTKRMIADLEYKDQQNDVVKEILRVYVHNDIINLSQADFDEFILFLNLNTEFLKSANDYDLITYIKSKFEHFQRIKEGY